MVYFCTSQEELPKEALTPQDFIICAEALSVSAPVLYHTVAGNQGIPVYPDLLFSHPYQEKARRDQNFYFFVLKALSLASPHTLAAVGLPSCDFARHRERVTAFFESLTPLLPSPFFTPGEEALLNNFSQRLCLSVTMHASFMQLMHYQKLQSQDLTAWLNQFVKEHPLDAALNKKEGKIYYDLLKDAIL